MNAIRAQCVVLLLLHVLPFVGRPALIGGDEPHYALMAHSIAVDGDIDLEHDYRSVAAGSKAAGRSFAGRELEAHVIDYHGKWVFSHPLGLPLLAAPWLWVQNLLVPGAAPDLVLGLLTLGLTFVALLEGLRLMRCHSRCPTIATFVGVAVYFTTPLWFYSRTFFTEPYIWALLVLALGLLDRRRPCAASMLMGVAFLVKESTLVLIVPLELWICKRWGWRTTVRSALFPLLAFVVFCAKNRWIYGDWLVTFQPFQLGSLRQGILGVLLDTRHGLLPFAPLAVAALIAWGAAMRDRDALRAAAAQYALLAFAATFLLTALWIDWRGGSGYGPRLLVPVLPTLAMPLMMATEGGRWRWFRPLVILLAIGGFAVQWSAVTSPFRAFWSISVSELVVDRPVPTVTGLIVAVVGTVWLLRQRGPAIIDERDAGGACLR